MATKKYLDIEGLQHLLDKLGKRQVLGKGLSTVDFTQALYNKLNALQSSTEIAAVAADVAALKNLIEADSDSTINKFNEIVAFLAGINNTDTLDALLGDIATQIAAVKKTADAAATKTALASVQASLDDAIKTLDSHDLDITGLQAELGAANDVIAVMQPKVDAAATKASVDALTTTVNGKLNASDIVAVTTAEIDALISA